MVRAVFVLAAAAGLAACLGPPVRDVFIPPYAEKGCWVRLFERAQFAGPMRELEGPVFVEVLGATPVVVPNRENIGRQPLFAEMHALEVGPHARLTGYSRPLFRGNALEIGPGSRIPELAVMGFHDRVESFIVSCEA